MTDLNFRAAIFDLDGTLLDSHHVWPDIDVKFLLKRGISPVPEDYSENLASMTFRETAEYTIQRFHLNEQPEDLMQEWNQMAIDAYSYEVQMKPFAREYLLHLRQNGIRLGVCTALPKKLHVPCLQNLGIYDWFDAIISTDDVTKGKSHPEPFLLSAARLGVSPRECVMFEDTPAAVSGALQAGMKVCGVYDIGTKKHIDLMKTLADRYIYDFSELLP